MVHSPPEILRAALLAGGVGHEPDVVDASLWPVFVDHLPPKPNQAICVYRTSGIREGRIMATGESIRKAGWQIRVRANDHSAVWQRASLVQTYLDTIQNLDVGIGGRTYTIKAVTQVGDALDLGQEADADRRNNATLNGTITL